MAISIGIGNYIRSSLYNRQGKKSPFHPSLVDYWSFAGKKNSDADRDVIKGIKGNILNACNFSWSLSNGYGQYLEDYRNYGYSSDKAIIKIQSYYIFSISESKSTNPFFYKSEGANKYKIKVEGIKDGQGLKYLYGLNDGQMIDITKDGQYELPSGDMAEFQCTFIGRCSITVEQVPYYQGALVFDGIASKLEGNGKLPILTDYTLIMRRKYLGEPVIPAPTPLTTLGLFGQGNFSDYAFIFENGIQNDPSSYTSISYGDEKSITLVTDNDWTWQTKSKYRGATAFDNPSGRQLQGYLYVGGGLGGQTTPSKVAVWDIAIYSKSLTEEEIQEEIDKMNQYNLIGDYVFDKSNSDIDRDKVYNKFNPNQYIELYNFGYNLNSGYGLYKENYLSYRTYLHPADKRADLTCTDSIINITEIYNNKAKFIEKQSEASTDYSIKVTGLTDDIDLYYTTYKTDGGVEIKLANGINNLLAGENYTGFRTKNFIGKCDITIEQIPEYPNHLVFDGVNDYTSPIPNFNVNEGTVLVQYNPIDTYAVKMLSKGELGTFYSYTFFIGSVNIQSRGADATTRVEIPINAEDTISAFAYDSTGINLFSNGIFKTSNNVNNKYQYTFGRDWNSALYGKLALKRVKIFDKKLTENQIKKEYNKLLNE